MTPLSLRWLRAEMERLLGRRKVLTSDYLAVFVGTDFVLAVDLIWSFAICHDNPAHRFERLWLRYGGKLHDAAFSNVNLR